MLLLLVITPPIVLLLVSSSAQIDLSGVNRGLVRSADEDDKTESEPDLSRLLALTVLDAPNIGCA